MLYQNKMAHFCWYLRILFLLLMLFGTPFVYTRPARKTSSQSDLIAGNEFLKLFLKHEERNLHSNEYLEPSSFGIENSSSKNVSKISNNSGNASEDNTTGMILKPANRSANARSLDSKSRFQSLNSNDMNDSKQLVKLVTTGSKIVFFEEFNDEDEAIVDAAARDLDLQKETSKASKEPKQSNQLKNPNDEVKVVAVSISSSSKRSQSSVFNKQMSKGITATQTVSTTQMPAFSELKKQKNSPLTLTTTLATTSVTMSNEFINRSHKSEFSIEEAEPLTMLPHKRRFVKAKYDHTSNDEAADSENSASTNIQNILAAPLVAAAASMRSSVIAPVNKSDGFHATPQSQRKSSTSSGGQRNATLHINQNAMTGKAHVIELGGHSKNDADDNISSLSVFSDIDHADVEDKLLPFQTVIYHDTREGHGPQSRSISYSSLSQNVADLQKWKKTGILNEAQHNISESLKPSRKEEPQPYVSQPAKFYSIPSKMYSVPAKFYSEPAKVYSEPAKVYGEPEKIYSEPAKVYSQPSKFYSEPAKVYSQPAKVYSEPAKTYWPQQLEITTTPATSSFTAPKTTTTKTTFSQPINGSKKPAIVSRIAFGEAQSPISTTTTKKPTTTTSSSPQIAPRFSSFNSNRATYQNQQQQDQQYNHGHNTYHSSAQTTTPPRRLLFNLDKLPYDLLNSPEQSSKPLLQPLQRQSSFHNNKNNINGHGTHPNYGHDESDNNERETNGDDSDIPCFETPFSTTSLSLSTSQNNPEQRQHSSFSIQHPYHKPNGFLNKDLVKCVSKLTHGTSTSLTKENDRNGVRGSKTNNDYGKNENYSTSSALSSSSSSSSLSPPSLHYTTESSSNNDDLYTSTPEQNYEIKESVSVMSNGRAHGVQSVHPTSLPIQSTTATIEITNFKKPTRISFGTKVNANVATINFNSEDSNNKYLKNGHIHQHQQHQQHQQQHHHNIHSFNNKNFHFHSPNSDHLNDYIQSESGGTTNDEKTDDNNEDNDEDADHHEKSDNEDAKVAYVLEGRNYHKYRVEEKTDEGFIVGEYGEVDHNVGNLRGVRYTADSTINPSLIQKALLTFLELK